MSRFAFTLVFAIAVCALPSGQSAPSCEAENCESGRLALQSQILDEFRKSLLDAIGDLSKAINSNLDNFQSSLTADERKAIRENVQKDFAKIVKDRITLEDERAKFLKDLRANIAKVLG